MGIKKNGRRAGVLGSVTAHNQEIVINKKLFFVILVSALIVLWQGTLALWGDRQPHDYRNSSASGARQGQYEPYVPFFYYTGLFPVTTADPGNLPKSRAEALAYLEPGKGGPLITETAHATRTGDYGPVLVMRLEAAFRGSPEGVSIRPFNIFFFNLALVAVWVSFFYCGQGLLGALLVLFAGSDPFLIFENYRRLNIFGELGPLCLLLLSLHAPLIFGRKTGRWIYGVPAASALLLVFFKQFRPEAAALYLTPLGAYLLAPGLKPLRRALLVFLLLSVSALAFAGWAGYWNSKFEESSRKVAEAGGNVYPGERVLYHHFWHALWCGLGDFGEKYGYEWDDQKAYRYAIPVLEKRFGVEYEIEGEWYFREKGEGAENGWTVKPETDARYLEVVRDKVLRDILNDPLWYAGILGKRAGRILGATTPVRIAAGPWHLTIPFSGWAAVPLLLFFLVRNNRPYFLVILLLVPLSLPALVLYSGRGMTYYSLYHLASFAILAKEAVLWLKQTFPAARRRQPQENSNA